MDLLDTDDGDSLWKYNIGQAISRLCHILVQTLLTRSETELGCYHRKVNVRVVSQVAEWLKIYDLVYQEISKKFLRYLELIAGTQINFEIANFDNDTRKLQKISCKVFHRRIYLVYNILLTILVVKKL